MLFPRPRRPLRFLLALLVATLFLNAKLPAAQLQIVDAITGQAIPSSYVTRSISAEGEALQVHSPAHEAMSLVLPAGAGAAYPVRIKVPPLAIPQEVQPATIAADLRPDSHLILGYVVDDETAQPLSQVLVSAGPSGNATRSDERGFFKLRIPVATPRASEPAPEFLLLSKPGFTTMERRNLRLWPYGDSIYTVRLGRMAGSVVVDERDRRRHREVASPELSPQMQPFMPAAGATRLPDGGGGGVSGSSVRVPTMIRVLHEGVVHYETMEDYVRHSLPSEWIASWGNYTGGINSLKAGAVAIRTYAIGYVNSPLTSTYDICATTSCQVYDPDFTDVRSTTAVDQTLRYVMVNSSGNIPRGLTEYSAENNSLGFACGDGFTAPSGGCLADPVCTGETRYGHGRGMCQWGSVRWATALTFPNRSSSGNTATGYPRQDWIWILEHYYPQLRLVQGSPVTIDALVEVTGISGISVRRCSDGGIAEGVNCPAVATKAVGATGTVIAGPVHVLSDGFGYTWWKIQWSDGLLAWAIENNLDLLGPSPPAPSTLVATALATNRIFVSWDYSTNVVDGFTLEQAASVNGPWTEIATVSAGGRNHSVSNLAAGVTYYFRVRAFHEAAESSYSNVAQATTIEPQLVLLPIAHRTVAELSTLTFTAVAVAPERVQPLTDFENFVNPANGTVLFRTPTLSGTTAGFLEASPNESVVTQTFPAGHGGNQVLRARFSFNTTAYPWLRLTTSAASQIPNPVIDLGALLRFDLHSSREIALGVGVREANVPAGTPIGSNGGVTGPIEWSGVTNRVGTQPRPSRIIPANTWTNLQFALKTEPAVSFSGGDGMIATASGLAVLEHLAIVPTTGTGEHDIFLDNFMIVRPRRVTFALGANAPAGAAINSTNGLFSWTPTEAQGPAVYSILVRVTDDSVPPQTNSVSFNVTVTELNVAPELAAVSNRTVHVGTSIVVSNSAVDPDWPPNVLTFSLPSSPAGAEINASSGEFRWQPSASHIGTTNRVIVGVRDNGSPVGSDLHGFDIVVEPEPSVAVATVADGMLRLHWKVIPGQRYQVQHKQDLNLTTWNNLGPIRSANTNQIEILEPTSAAQRFFRLLVVE